MRWPRWPMENAETENRRKFFQVVRPPAVQLTCGPYIHTDIQLVRTTYVCMYVHPDSIISTHSSLRS